MKKICYVFVLLFVATSLLCGCGGHKDNSPKNLIIIIGDGMGINHIQNAKAYFGMDFVFEDDFVCEVTTNSANNSVTDSAAAATAIATGQKVNNHEVGYHNGENLENIMEIAHRNGKKTAIFTSDTITGATPACFSAHATDRDNSTEIVLGQANSNIDLFVAKSNSAFKKNVSAFENNGYQTATTLEELQNFDKTQKGVATFKDLRSYYNQNVSPTNFNSALTYTLDYLKGAENGFCLMIENAYIDKFSHDNNFYGAMQEMKMFNDTIQLVYDFCEENQNTAVLITADHETGGLQYATENFSDALYTKSGHTGSNVALYLKYAQIEHSNVLDNTDIFKFCKSYIEAK